MKRGSQCACCCNNNVNAFLTCTTRSMLVCTRLIIAPLIYSLYFPPWWWFVPPPCLHSLHLGVSLFLSLARYAAYGEGKKRVWCEVFRHAIGRTYVWGGRGGCDVEIKRTRKRMALVDGAVVAFMSHTTIRICWGINRNMHAYYLLFHERTTPATIIAAECRALTSNASNACSSVMVCGRSGEKELLFISEDITW